MLKNAFTLRTFASPVKSRWLRARWAGMSAAKREKILAGVMMNFMRESFSATGMEKIAKEACVSEGTLYDHFESTQAGEQNLLCINERSMAAFF